MRFELRSFVGRAMSWTVARDIGYYNDYNASIGSVRIVSVATNDGHTSFP